MYFDAETIYKSKFITKKIHLLYFFLTYLVLVL